MGVCSCGGGGGERGGGGSKRVRIWAAFELNNGRNYRCAAPRRAVPLSFFNTKTNYYYSNLKMR